MTARFVVGGASTDGSAVLWSSIDGLTSWAPIVTPWDNLFSYMNAVRNNGREWLALGESGAGGQSMLRSTDGITWAPVAVDVFTYATDAAYSPSLDLWVAVGQASVNRIATSPDGDTWTLVAPAAISDYEAIGWGDGLFVIGGSDGGVSPEAIMTSPDGVTWTARSSPFDATGGSDVGFVFGVAHNGTQWLALGRERPGGTGIMVATSADGLTWTPQTTPLDVAASGWAMFCAAWDGSQWIAGGHTGGDSLQSSPDGVTWTAVPNSLTSVEDIAWAVSAWVAGGGDTTSSVETSPDGATWTLVAAALDDGASGVAYGDGVPPVVLSADQFQLDSTPTLLMGVDSPYQVVRFTGPRRQMQTKDLPFNQADGVYRSRDTRGGMTFSLDLEVEASDDATLAENIASLLAAWVPVAEGSDRRFTWRLLGQDGSRYADGSPRAVSDVIWDQHADEGGVALVFIDFFASIPVIKLTADDTVVAY